MRVHDIIKKAVITEKALSEGRANVYVFEVDNRASKHQVKHAVEELFGVEVGTVKTLVRKGKTRRTGRRMVTKTLPDVKKAYVTVTKGSIDIIPKS